MALCECVLTLGWGNALGTSALSLASVSASTSTISFWYQTKTQINARTNLTIFLLTMMCLLLVANPRYSHGHGERRAYKSLRHWLKEGPMANVDTDLHCTVLTHFSN